MQETLLEFFDSRGLTLRVDRNVGVLRGVKLLGLESRNGRTYLPEALTEASHLYEGAKVNVNHPKGSPVGPRDYQDRIGIVRNVQLREGEGLFGDFFFNPEHALAGQLAWDAAHAPENVGFSHNVEARVARRGQQIFVEAITRVQSVDLVADPATTRGLFESLVTSDVDLWQALSLETLQERRPDLVEALSKSMSDELAQLREEIDRLRAVQATHEKQELSRRLLAEYNLSESSVDEPWSRWAVSAAFIESLLEARDETHMRGLVAERAQLVEQARCSGRPTRPLSRDQHLAETVVAPRLDTTGFVRSIT